MRKYKHNREQYTRGVGSMQIQLIYQTKSAFEYKTKQSDIDSMSYLNIACMFYLVLNVL